MSYHFHVNGETYIGRNIPGAARMRIFHSDTGRLVVAFDPDVRSLRSHRPWGSWAYIHPDVDVDLLETLQPQVLSACQSRLRHFDNIRRIQGPH